MHIRGSCSDVTYMYVYTHSPSMLLKLWFIIVSITTYTHYTIEQEMAPGTMHVGVSVVVLLRTCIYALGCGVDLIIRKYLWHCFIMGPL